MTKKQTDDTIYDAEFTESAKDKAETKEEAADADTDSSLVIAENLKPLDPRQTTDGESMTTTKFVITIVVVIALLVLIGLYLRGLQLATV